MKLTVLVSFSPVSYSVTVSYQAPLTPCLCYPNLEKNIFLLSMILTTLYKYSILDYQY